MKIQLLCYFSHTFSCFSEKHTSNPNQISHQIHQCTNDLSHSISIRLFKFVLFLTKVSERTLIDRCFLIPDLRNDLNFLILSQLLWPLDTSLKLVWYPAPMTVTFDPIFSPKIQEFVNYSVTTLYRIAYRLVFGVQTVCLVPCKLLFANFEDFSNKHLHSPATLSDTPCQYWFS